MYLGYANYLTFTVALWFDNNRKHSVNLSTAIEAIRTYDASGYPDVRVAEWLEMYVSNSFALVMKATENDDSVAGTFLSHGLTLVDWLGLARKYLNEKGS